jgi:transposase InsO family protein
MGFQILTRDDHRVDHRPVQDRGDPLPGPWRNRDAVEMATLEWVDWYNNRRLFEALGDIPPAEAESAYYATMTPSESPRMAEQTLH